MTAGHTSRTGAAAVAGGTGACATAGAGAACTPRPAAAPELQALTTPRAIPNTTRTDCRRMQPPTSKSATTLAPGGRAGKSRKDRGDAPRAGKCC